MSDTLADETILTLYSTEGDGASINVAADEEQVVLAAMRKWLSSARTQDTLLSLTSRSGAEYHVLASTLTSILKTTPSDREHAVVLNKRDEDELREYRRAHGFIDGVTD